MLRSAIWLESAPLARLRPVLLLAAALGCNHAEPFHLGPQDPQGPRTSVLPHQVTFGGPDLPAFTPSMSADGNGWLYSAGVRTSPIILDRCIAGLPLKGGGQTRTFCDVTFGRSGLASNLTWPVELADGRLIYVRNLAFPNNAAVFDGSLVMGTFGLRDSGMVLRRFPYPASRGEVHGMTHIALLNSHTLIYVATRVDFVGSTSSDSVESGLQIERFDIDHPPAVPDVIDNTELASSVEPAPDGRSFYYTVNGESRVYHRTLASGATDTVYDFGALGIARDVRVADSVLYAVVGGLVSMVQADTSVASLVQRDHGGNLMRVDLRTGVASTYVLPGLLVQHPALSRDGKVILFEDWGIHTLWLVGAP